MKMYTKSGEFSKQYQSIIFDRLLQIAHELGSVSDNAKLVEFVIDDGNISRFPSMWDEYVVKLAKSIVEQHSLFSSSSKIFNSFARDFLQGNFENKQEVISALSRQFSIARERVQEKRLNESNELTSKSLQSTEENLLQAITILRVHRDAFVQASIPLRDEDIYELFSQMKEFGSSGLFTLSLEKYNPIISSVVLDSREEKFFLHVNESLLSLRDSSMEIIKKEKINKYIFDELAKLSRKSGEALVMVDDRYEIELKKMKDSSGLIILSLAHVFKSESNLIRDLISKEWNPKSRDLSKDNYPIVEWPDFKTNPPSKQHFKMVLYSPIMTAEETLQGMKDDSLYVILKDWVRILEKFSDENSLEYKHFRDDFDSIEKILRKNGFFGYPGYCLGLSREFKDDYIFELPSPYLPLLEGLMEKFHLLGTKRVAVIEVSDLSNRLMESNEIETKIQENLLKWRDAYNLSQVDPSPGKIFEVPSPTKNSYWENFKLICRSHLRGDAKKAIKFGMDLSGGKTILLSLKDRNNRRIVDERSIEQCASELHKRLNNLGVSDIQIRREGDALVVDIPIGNESSAEELVKSSSMTFNVVKRSFSYIWEFFKRSRAIFIRHLE